LTEGKIGVLSVSSLFLTRVGVYVGVCVCTRAHTHTLYRWGTRCEPKSQDETPGGPEASRWTQSRHTYIRMCVQSTHVYVYAKRRDEILDELLFSSTYFFFRKRKAKDVNANHRQSHIIIPRFEHIDPQSKVLNHYL